MCAGGTGLAICSAITYVGGTTSLIGGTSLSSPLSMGSWARIESAHGNKLGFAAPLIYQLANGAGGTAVTPTSPYFNDVVTGGNGLYTALPGYDYVTGLGTWDITVVNGKSIHLAAMRRWRAIRNTRVARQQAVSINV